MLAISTRVVDGEAETLDGFRGTRYMMRADPQAVDISGARAVGPRAAVILGVLQLRHHHAST
jgi:hypothetical protein